VEEIEPTQIDKWIAHVKRPEYLAQCHSTRCSYDHEFSVLRVILNFYSSRFNRNYRLPFIADHNEMLKVRNKPIVKKDLTVDQLKAFIFSLREKCWGTRWEAIYYLALMQYGIYGRIQDAAALSYEDFDFVRDRLIINKKVQWLRAKGYADRIVSGSKTNGGKILTPIPELAAKVFKEWIVRSGVRFGPLFQIDDKLITYRQIEDKYTQALQKAGLPFSATHIIRHAALTEA
jgi:integrase